MVLHEVQHPSLSAHRIAAGLKEKRLTPVSSLQTNVIPDASAPRDTARSGPRGLAGAKLTFSRLQLHGCTLYFNHMKPNGIPDGLKKPLRSLHGGPAPGLVNGCFLRQVVAATLRSAVASCSASDDAEVG